MTVGRDWPQGGTLDTHNLFVTLLPLNMFDWPDDICDVAKPYSSFCNPFVEGFNERCFILPYEREMP